METNIPKKIHYCWFGGNPLPEMAVRCIESWKKYCPDYEIIEWNENNFDVNCCEYSAKAYKNKKWAFVSDVARLYALVNYGGIYMDTDVEVVKPIDDILCYDAVSGFETEKTISTGLMGCKKGHPLFDELLHEYDNISFIKDDGSFDITTNVTRITDTCLKYGLKLDNTLQTVKGFTLLPKDYLCPKDYKTGIVNKTVNTLTIHHFDGSWHSEEQKLNEKLNRFFMKFLPKTVAWRFAKFISVLRFNGLKAVLSETKNVLKGHKNEE